MSASPAARDQTEERRRDHSRDDEEAGDAKVRRERDAIETKEFRDFRRHRRGQEILAASTTALEISSAHDAAASARSRLSVSNWRMIRPRDAPSDRRMAISRCRANARASIRFDTLAQPISRIRPNATKSGENPSSDLERERRRDAPRSEEDGYGLLVGRKVARVAGGPQSKRRARLSPRTSPASTGRRPRAHRGCRAVIPFAVDRAERRGSAAPRNRPRETPPVHGSFPA